MFKGGEIHKQWFEVVAYSKYAKKIPLKIKSNNKITKAKKERRSRTSSDCRYVFRVVGDRHVPASAGREARLLHGLGGRTGSGVLLQVALDQAGLLAISELRAKTVESKVGRLALVLPTRELGSDPGAKRAGQKWCQQAFGAKGQAQPPEGNRPAFFADKLSILPDGDARAEGGPETGVHVGQAAAEAVVVTAGGPRFLSRPAARLAFGEERFVARVGGRRLSNNVRGGVGLSDVRLSHCVSRHRHMSNKYRG